MAESRSQVNIFEAATAKISEPDVILGVPEVGLVGSIATSYLIQQLKLPEIGYIDSNIVLPVVVVHQSEPKYPIRIYGKGGLVVVISETPFTPRLAYELTRELVIWAKTKQSRTVIGLTGIPSKNRETAEKENPTVFAVSNEPKLLDSIKAKGAQPFEEGILGGSYAMLLKNCMTIGVPNLTLLSEALLEFPDPGAAAAVIAVLNSQLDLNVDLKPLLEESEEIRLKSRELMNSTQQTLQQQATQATPSVYR